MHDDSQPPRRGAAPVRRSVASRTADVWRRLSSRDLAPLVSVEYSGRPLDAYEAKQWALTLSARGIPHVRRRSGQGFALFVPKRRADEAVEEIRSFLSENSEDPVVSPVPRKPGNAGTVFWSLGAAGAFLAYLGSDSYFYGHRIDWTRIGSGDSTAMLAGAWELAVTALTLHADPPHLIGNLAVGGLFLLLLCRETGVGLGFFLTLAAGALGNWLKVELQGPGQHFLGASTAVFGALGVLGGLRSCMGFAGASWKRALPAGAGLMLLAMLGSAEEGERIDLVGHICGFGAGLVLGLLTGIIRRKDREMRRTEGLAGVLWGSAAVLLVLVSWAAALRRSLG